MNTKLISKENNTVKMSFEIAEKDFRAGRYSMKMPLILFFQKRTPQRLLNWN